MIIFRCNKDKEENIQFAIEHGVWQTDRDVAEGVEEGEVIALQVTGSKEITVLGRATTVLYDDAPYAWPSGDTKYTKTVRFEPINLAGQWPHKKV